MSLMEELRILDVNVDEALGRFMGNAALYEKMLKTFPDMLSKSAVGSDFDSENYQDIIEKTHAIKGVTGNLSLTPLYEGYTKIVDLLRGGQPEQAKAVIEEILPVQAEIVGCIEKYL